MFPTIAPSTSAANKAEISRRRRLVHRRLQQKTAADHVYRKPSPGTYTNCCFLDDSQAVLAVDTFGFIDILELQNQESSERVHSDALVNTGDSNCRRVASMRLESNQAAVPAGLGSSYTLYCPQRHSFVVGLPNGHLHLYDTEYGVKQKEIQSHFALRHTPTSCAPTIHTATDDSSSTNHHWWHPTRTRQRLKELSLSQRIDTSTTVLNDDNIVATGRRVDRPLRRYQPSTTASSLAQEWDNPSIVAEREEIYRWNQPDNSNSNNFHILPDRDCQWDFWSGNESLLYALQYGQDFLAATIVDSRLEQAQTAIAFCTTNRVHMAVTQAKHHPWERFDAACFVSDRHVLTAAADCSAITNNKNCQLRLALWDLRYASSRSGSCSNKPVATYSSCSTATNDSDKERLLPSFPRNVPLPLEVPMDASTFHFKKEKTVISDIHLQWLLDGQVVITTELRHEGKALCTREHYLIDPGRGLALEKPKLRQRIPSSYMDGCLPPYCVSKATPSVVASYCLAEDPKPAKISLEPFDSSATMGRGRKRRSVGGTFTVDMDSNERIITTDFVDRWGTTTDLNSLAFNCDESCLVGTSRDGDVFSWRA